MKISIRHIPNTFNYGSLMMAINTIDYLNKNIKDAEFFVDCRTEEDLDRLKRETGIENIKIAPTYDDIAANNVITKIIKRVKISRLEGKFYDIKIILGGDDISEYYIKKGWLIIFPIMFIENINLPTIFLGQTIGPFTSYRRLLARFTLNRAKIYTRDDESLEYVKRLGIKNVHKGRDLAFLELPMQYKAKSILKKYRLKPDTYITVVPSGLTRCYTDKYNAYITEQHNIIKNIMNNQKLDGKKIVLLAHVKADGTADKTVIEDLENRLTSEEKLRIIVIKEEILASEAREILGNGFFTITGRMHAAVSTFYMRKPAISLSYSVKYQGVIGNGLDMGDLVIEAADSQLWENGKISKMVSEKTQYLLENYNELVRKIDMNVNTTSQLAMKQLDNVLEDIKSIYGKIKSV